MALLLPDERNKFTSIKFGSRVEKASVLSADDDLFDFKGECLVTLMFGEVTGVLAGASTVALNEKADSIALVAVTTITNDPLNTIYLLGGQPDIVFNGGKDPTVAVATMTAEHDSLTDRSASHTPIIINGASAGVTIESTETGADTGVITWVIFYHPLEIGAYIEAAA